MRTQQLRLCLDALEKRDKQVADLSIECATKGKLATMEEAQRDEALKTASTIAAPSRALTYVVIGAASVTAALTCPTGKTELCLASLGAAGGAGITLLSW